MTDREKPMPSPRQTLSGEDRAHIAAIFEDEMVPKLNLMHARIGNINCSFAGEQYKHWNLQFRSSKSGFEVVDFEYDEDSRELDLPDPFRTVQIDDHA